MSEPAESQLDDVRAAPKGSGTLELIALRPAPAERETPAEAMLDPVDGLVGDRWRPESSSPDSALTLMSARAAALVAGPRERWALAGDQLYVDLDISCANLPPGTRLAVGEAVIEITPAPHTGCGKFLRRFGVEMMKLVNSPVGRELNLRGVNARVVTGGVIRLGDMIEKLPAGGG